MPERAIVVLDDDFDLAGSVARLLGRHGYRAEALSDPEPLLARFTPESVSCIVSDVMLGARNGFEVAAEVRRRDPGVALVFMTAWPSAAAAVDAVRRHGGFDYLDKPIDEPRLIESVREAVSWSAQRRAADRRLSLLTRREREVFDLLVRGLSNKAVAAALSLSPKTVEDHRASVVAKTGAESLADLIRIAEAIRQRSGPDLTRSNGG